jgi:hypothetical protein
MTSLADVEATFSRWLQMKDAEPLRVALATVAANRLPGDPSWQFLVAPPSGLKTEIIRSLNGIPEIYPLSTITAQTFASGFVTKGRRDPSLLYKLDGRVLTMKDFTSVLSLNYDKRTEILGQLREIYDGAYHKEFGNGHVVDWTGKIGLVAGVTPVLDMQYTVNQMLGERFLLYRLKADAPLTVARRAIEQRGKELPMRDELRGAVHDFFAQLEAHEVPLQEGLLERLSALACLTARARSAVLWDHQGEMSYVPGPEGPARLAKQFSALGAGLALIRGGSSVTLEDYATLYKVALDTMPAQRTTMLNVLRQDETALTTATVAERSRYPTATARRYLEELTAVDLVDRELGGGGRPDHWRLSQLASQWLEQASPL